MRPRVPEWPLLTWRNGRLEWLPSAATTVSGVLAALVDWFSIRDWRFGPCTGDSTSLNTPEAHKKTIRFADCTCKKYHSVSGGKSCKKTDFRTPQLAVIAGAEIRRVIPSIWTQALGPSFRLKLWRRPGFNAFFPFF